MKCNNCGNEMEEKDLFCVKCGKKVEKEIPLAPIEPEAIITPIAPQTPEIPIAPVVDPILNMGGTPNYYPGPTPVMPAGKPVKRKKGGLIFGIIGGIIVILAVLAFVFLFPKQEKVDNSKLFYVEDNELFMANLKSADFDPVRLSDEYQDNSHYWTDYGVSSANITTSSDGKTYFIPTEIDDNYCYNLCAVTIKKGEAVVEKIDSSVSSYQLLSDDTILYSKSGKLYFYDGENKTKIASNVEYYILSSDQKNILWTEQESLNEETYEYTVNVYFQAMNLKDEAICIVKDVEFMGNSDDLLTIYFTDNSDLYVSDVNGNKEKLISDCNNVYPIDIEKNIFYYTVNKSEETSAMDYVIDDFAASDAAITEPAVEDFETEAYDEFWGYSYTETDWDAYYAAYELYQEKYNRDILREELLAYIIPTSIEDLYYYNGSDSELVTENFYYFYVYPTDNSFVCAIMEPSDIARIPITDIYSAYDVEYQIGYGDLKALVSYNGTTEYVEEDQLDAFWLGDEKLFYTTSNEYVENEFYTYTLNSFDLTSSKFGKTEEITDEMNSFERIYNGKAYYICNADYDSSEGDLYCDMDEIASDVRMWSLGFFPNEDALCYTTDLDLEEESITLMVNKNGKEEEIGSNISYFSALNSSYFVYLQNFDLLDSCGDLVLYDNGKVEDIATDVSLFTPFSGGLSGTMYGSW